MAMLRPIELSSSADVAAVLELNERDVHWLAPMDSNRLRYLVERSDRADVLDMDGEVAGFVICFAPGADYDSSYYQWHAQRYADFYYLDRIVLHPRHRRRGLGGVMYDELEAVARAHGRMSVEVSVDNVASLAFHRRRGYRDLADFEDEPGHRVTMMAKELDGRERTRAGATGSEC